MAEAGWVADPLDPSVKGWCLKCGLCPHQTSDKGPRPLLIQTQEPHIFFVLVPYVHTSRNKVIRCMFGLKCSRLLRLVEAVAPVCSCAAGGQFISVC